MQDEVVVSPAGHTVEEVRFNLLALATRVGKDCDSRDWFGSTLADYAVGRAFGFPLLDFAVFPPAAIQVVLQLAHPTVVGVEPPALNYVTEMTWAGVGVQWTTARGIRLPGRYWRLNVTDTSNAANNDIYLVYFVRGA